MKTTKLTVTCRGTVIITDDKGKQHEGYVSVKLAGKTIEVGIYDTQWIAYYKGIGHPVVPYTGQDGQLDLFEARKRA